MFWGCFWCLCGSSICDREDPYSCGNYSLMAVDKQNKKTNKEISGSLTIKMKFKPDEGDKHRVNQEKGTDTD